MKTSKQTKFILAIAALALTAGCGKVSLNLNNVLPGNPFSFLGLSSGTEFVSSSAQGQKTVNAYSANSSAGAAFGQLVTKTPGGYTVYTTVQGQEISDLTTTTATH